MKFAGHNFKWKPALRNKLPERIEFRLQVIRFLLS